MPCMESKEPDGIGGSKEQQGKTFARHHIYIYMIIHITLCPKYLKTRFVSITASNWVGSTRRPV